MIAEGGGAQGDAPEQADDGSNTDIYLNMSGDEIEAPSIQDDAAAEQDDAAGEQSANVHITTILVLKIIFSFESIWILYKYMCVFYSRLDHRRSRKRWSEAPQRNWKGGTL